MRDGLRRTPLPEVEPDPRRVRRRQGQGRRAQGPRAARSPYAAATATGAATAASRPRPPTAVPAPAWCSTTSTRPSPTARPTSSCACRSCNSRKGQRTPEAAGMNLLPVPGDHLPDPSWSASESRPRPPVTTRLSSSPRRSGGRPDADQLADQRRDQQVDQQVDHRSEYSRVGTGRDGTGRSTSVTPDPTVTATGSARPCPGCPRCIPTRTAATRSPARTRPTMPGCRRGRPVARRHVATPEVTTTLV